MKNGKKNVKKAGAHTKFDFKVGVLYCGWMDVEITVDGESFSYSFDEGYHNVIDLVNAYNAISDDGKEQESSLWKDDALSFGKIPGLTCR